MRGRPRKFDEAEAVDAATRVFWTKGYDGVTVDDLVAGMGVSRPSLYAIFGDKADVFVRCLETYGASLGARATAALHGPAHVADAIAAFLRFSVDNATAPDSPAGCLIVCIAPLVEDPRVRAYLATAGEQTIAVVERRLRAGIAAGELPASFPAAQRARLAIDLSRGLSVRARLGGARRELRRDAASAAALVTSAASAASRRAGSSRR